MPTTVTKTIGSTGDYSTPTLWEAFLDGIGNLVTADEAHVGELQNQEFTVAGTVLTFSGQTTDSTRNITLKCVSGASFKDNASVRTNPLLYNASNGAAIRSTSDYSVAVAINTNYVRLEGLQISGPTGGAGALSGSGTNNINDSCIFRAPATNATNVSMTGSAVQMLNCLLVGGYSGFTTNGGGTVIVAGCTIIKTGSAGNTGVTINYSTYTVKNTAIFNFSTVSSFNGSTNSGSGYNATNGASAPGSNNQTSLTYADQFENTSSDWRAKSTGSLQAGTPDSTYTPDDITGLTRDATTPWIGCWEIAASGSIVADIEPGSYSITGTAISLEWNREINIDSGSYSLTGTAISLEYGREVAAAVGTYTITGTAAGLYHHSKIIAASGSYGLTGTAISLEYGHKLVTGSGVYSLSGSDIGFAYSGADKTISIEPGSYSLVGTSINLEYGYKLGVGSGVYNLSGTDVGLSYSGASKTINVESASYILTGSPLSFQKTWRITVGGGSYNLTGSSVTFIYSGGAVEDFLIFEDYSEPALALQIFSQPTLEIRIMAAPEVNIGEAYGVSIERIRSFLSSTPLTDGVLEAQMKDSALVNVGSPITLSYVGGSRYRYVGNFPASVTSALDDEEVCYIDITGTAGGLPVNRRLVRKANLAA